MKIFSLCFLFLLLLCSMPAFGQQTMPAHPVSAASTPSVSKVENAGLLFTENTAGVSGTDAGYSLPIGRQTLWLFGDIFLLDPHAPMKNYVGGVSNAALLVSAGSGTAPLRQFTFLTDTKTGAARQVIPNGPGEGSEIRYWPFGGWYSAQEKRAYLYYARIRTTSGGGPLDFKIEGHGLASADVTNPASLVFQRLPAVPQQELWWTPEADKPLFGSAVVTDMSDTRHDYLYIVGVQERDGKKRGKLARVPAARIADRSAYAYFAGSPDTPRWSADIAQAADVEGLQDFPNELSIAYNAYLGGYLAVHSLGLAEKARLSLAPHPWGPYKQIAEIGTPHRAFAHAFCYAGKEHPELQQEHGRVIYITYVDSDRYWLQLLKVTLQKTSGE